MKDNGYPKTYGCILLVIYSMNYSNPPNWKMLLNVHTLSNWNIMFLMTAKHNFMYEMLKITSSSDKMKFLLIFQILYIPVVN